MLSTLFNIMKRQRLHAAFSLAERAPLDDPGRSLDADKAGEAGTPSGTLNRGTAAEAGRLSRSAAYVEEVMRDCVQILESW